MRKNETARNDLSLNKVERAKDSKTGPILWKQESVPDL